MRTTLKELLQIWYQHPLELNDELIRFWWPLGGGGSLHKQLGIILRNITKILYVTPWVMLAHNRYNTNTCKNKAIQQTEGQLHVLRTLSLFCHIFYSGLTAWQERWSSWRLCDCQIGLRLFLYMNSEHPDGHQGQPTRYDKKKKLNMAVWPQM